MLIILPEFTIKLEDFTAFKVVYNPFFGSLEGYTGGEWIALYIGCCEEDAREKKALLDEAIMISQRSCCPECGENNMTSIQLVQIDDECCEEYCPDEEICEDPDCNVDICKPPKEYVN